MNRLSWTIFALLVVCHVVLAAPSTRVKRQNTNQGQNQTQNSGQNASLDPTNQADAQNTNNTRERRKLPEAAFQSKNAVLGFVFGKIDQFIDAKTRFIDQLDKTNIEKNRQLGIQAPQPVPSFQALVSGIITPKINAISQGVSSLSSGVLGGLTSTSGASSGSSSSGGSSGSNGGDDQAAGGQAGGLSNILSSVLRLSGPILSASIGGAGGGIAAGNTTPDPDDDF